MAILYSNVPPLRIPNGGTTLLDYIKQKAYDTDHLYIAVGYASKKALLELNKIVLESNIKRIVLVLGMYYIEGFPESIYNTAMHIDEEWRAKNIGEIRITKSMKYHGKVYGFYSHGQLTSAVVGSHNLGAVAQEASNLRQYEFSVLVEEKEDCQAISAHLERLIAEPISFALNDVADVNIVHGDNTKLNGVEGVTKVSVADVETYKAAQTAICFNIPLKVPGIPDSTQDFMKSNINKCYAKGRLNTKTGVVTERGWWETEIIVSNSITSLRTYPAKDVPFFVITDDGWKFKMHVSGDHSKNLESDGDLKVLGYWLKGRLVAAGFIEPVDSPAADLENISLDEKDIYKNCKGVITYQKLKKYGRTSVSLTKTLNRLADDDGIMRDVWVLSFLPTNVK